jgi:p-aminobenzoyl-glutamate transporter AbgT
MLVSISKNGAETPDPIRKFILALAILFCGSSVSYILLFVVEKKLICYGNYHPNLRGKFKGLSFYFLALLVSISKNGAETPDPIRKFILALAILFFIFYELRNYFSWSRLSISWHVVRSSQIFTAASSSKPRIAAIAPTPGGTADCINSAR